MPEHRKLENRDSSTAHPGRLVPAGYMPFVEQLFRRNYSAMVHLARVMLGNDDEAEDVVQDVFLRMVEGDTALPFGQQPSASPKYASYLLTAVRNGCLNRMRRMRLHDKVKGLLAIDDDACLPPIDKGMDRLDGIGAYVDEQLAEPHRSIFHLRFDQDLTVGEIARRLGLNPNTAYKYLMQSLERIRQHLKNH